MQIVTVFMCNILVSITFRIYRQASLAKLKFMTKMLLITLLNNGKLDQQI